MLHTRSGKERTKFRKHASHPRWHGQGPWRQRMPGTATLCSCRRKKRREERLRGTGLSPSVALSTAAPPRPPAGPQGSRGGPHLSVPGDSQALGKMGAPSRRAGGQEVGDAAASTDQRDVDSDTRPAFKVSEHARVHRQTQGGRSPREARSHARAPGDLQEEIVLAPG